MLGCTAEAAVGRLPDGFFPDEELSRHAVRLGTEPAFADIAAASAATEDSATLWQFRRHDGECRTLRMTVTAVQEDEGGEITGHLCIAEDVTEREAAQPGAGHRPRPRALRGRPAPRARAGQGATSSPP